MSADLDRLALRVLLPAFAGTTLPAEGARLLEAGLGGVCLFGDNTDAGPEAVAVLTASMREAAGDVVVCIDEEGGDVTRVHADTGSPVLGAAALGFANDLRLTRRTGHAIGTELALLGITMNLGPVADVNSNPDNPVIGVRSFGSEPDRVATHVVAWLDGLQSAGVAACVKHFPGHGDTSEDSHLALPVVEADPDLLAGRELVPFVQAARAGASAVMTSHIVVPAIDSLPATLSAPVLSLLRTQVRYDGAIVTDALDMAGASQGRGIPRAAVMALTAGADALLIGRDHGVALIDEIRSAIVAAVRSGELGEERLADAAERTARLARRPARPEPIDLDEDDQLTGARTALLVEGTLPDLHGARMLRVGTTPNIAAGHVPWGLPGEDVEESDLAGAAGDPATLVVQVRDAHRRPEVVRLLRSRAASGRFTVVLEWGWPGPLPVPAPRICTFGDSLPSRTAAAAILRAAGATR